MTNEDINKIDMKPIFDDIKDVIDRKYITDITGTIILLQAINNPDVTVKQYLLDTHYAKDEIIKDEIEKIPDFSLSAETIKREYWERYILDIAPIRFSKYNYDVLKRNDALRFLYDFADKFSKMIGRIDKIYNLDTFTIIKTTSKIGGDNGTYYVERRDFNTRNYPRRTESTVFENLNDAMMYSLIGEKYYSAGILMMKEYEKKVE